MKVLKFGGTSVGSPEQIQVVTNIVAKSQRHTDIIVVVSAFSSVTNDLVKMSGLASQGNLRYKRMLDKVKDRHVKAVRKLSDSKRCQRTLRYVDDLLSQLENLLYGVYLIRERTPRTLDVVLSFGERLSAYIVAEAFRTGGISAEYLDARHLVRTDGTFGSAHVDTELTYESIKPYFKEHRKLQVITGFIGSTILGETTTLGRGGSDYTAALFGTTLGASVVEIWTDVDGFMTADPRKVTGARVIERLRYAEAAELSHFGAKVLHPPTIRPTIEKRIPIQIKNALHPEAPGTMIDTRSRNSSTPITGVASIPNIGLLQIQGDGMWGVPGVAERFFRALAQRRVNVVLITQASSEYSICVAVEQSRVDEAKCALENEFAREIEFGQIDAVDAEYERAIIAIVGENMRHTAGIAGQIFGALGDKRINVVAIAQGSSELNISIVVNRKDESRAVNAIHATFFTK